jgi:protein-L-isoaspartate(D-aspartate) O-methyltransferase
VTEGDPTGAPYDVIFLNGATEITPQRLLGQLKDGGRLVGVFANSQPARATMVTRSHGDFGNRTLFDATAPVLPGLERLPAFVF